MAGSCVFKSLEVQVSKWASLAQSEASLINIYLHSEVWRTLKEVSLSFVPCVARLCGVHGKKKKKKKKVKMK